MDRDHRNNGRRNDSYANASGEIKREVVESSDIKKDRHEEKRRQRKHGSSSSGKPTSKETEFVSFTNRFSREKLSRGAVISGSGLKEFIENNRPIMCKSVWEKKITPRSNSIHDNQSHSRSLLDSRLNQHDKQDLRYISPSYNEHQRRVSLDTRILDLESRSRRISVGSAGVAEPSPINTRHKRDDGYYTGDNREEVPMDIGSDDEDHGRTPVSDESMNRRDRHASSEINHNVKNKYNLNLEPLPVIKSENIKAEFKQEDGYVNNPHSKGSWSPTRLPRIGALENCNYEGSVTPPRRPNDEFRDNSSRRPNDEFRENSSRRPNDEFRENSSRRPNDEFRENSSRALNDEFRGNSSRRPNDEFRENMSRRPNDEIRENSPRRSHESRENSPRRSHESREKSEENHIPINHTPMPPEMPPEKVVRNMNEAIPMSWHCQIYLSGLKCHKGDYCDKIHKYPRENGVDCIDFMSGQCNRKADDCWFRHPGQVANEKEPDDSAPVVVQSMGGLLKYIKKEVNIEPNKYKSKEKPKRMSPPPKGRSGNANMVPLGSRKKGNTNMTPLGSRSERLLPTDNYSPLQPRRGTASSLSYDSNSSQQESFSILTPRSKSASDTHGYDPKSPLDRNNSKPSFSTENILSNNTDEENQVQSSSQEKDLSKTKYQFLNNPSSTVNEVEDGGKRKHKKKKKENSEETNTDHHISKDKSKKSKSNDENNRVIEGNIKDSGGADKHREKEKREVDKKGLKKAIGKLLDKAATGGGEWKRSSDPESDIKTLLEEFDIPIYSKGDKYKNMEINFRMLYLKFAKVDDDLKEHAFWFRKKYTDFSNLPKDHQNDIKCCYIE